MKNSNYKLFTFISILVLMFIIFLYLFFKEYSYEKKYVVNNFKITENFDSSTNCYKFTVEKDIIYPYIFDKKYNRKRKLIKDIKVFENNDEQCILPISDYIKFYPICKKDDTLYTYNLSNISDIPYIYTDIKLLNNNYNNIEIDYLNNNSILLYNYKGFYYISNNLTKEIKLFNNDVYLVNLVYQKDKYLIIADYNSNYYFNKFYIINITNGKTKEVNFDFDISFDSEFLGYYKNNVYLLDKKENKHYKISLTNNKIEETKDINIVNFNTSIYTYEIIDNTLYQTVEGIKIKVSNNLVDKIVKIDNETIYYLSKDNLYMYNNYDGEIRMLNNFEWNFNNTNMIYLYK